MLSKKVSPCCETFGTGAGVHVLLVSRHQLKTRALFGFADVFCAGLQKFSWRQQKPSGMKCVVHTQHHKTSYKIGIRFVLYVICGGAPPGDVPATEAYGEEVQRLLMICSREQDDDEDVLVSVAVNNLAYICRDLGTERFAPFFQSCIEVIANLLSNISPPEDDESDDLPSLKLMEAVSDALEVLTLAYGAGFLPALPVLFPPITALASPTSSGKAAFQHTHKTFVASSSPRSSLVSLPRRRRRWHHCVNRLHDWTRCSAQ
jgi:hypothetical protein